MIDLHQDEVSYTVPPNAPILAQAGVQMATGVASAYAALPLKTDGTNASRIRLACTVACRFRMGLPIEALAVDAAAGTGYSINDLITLAGGISLSPMVLKVTHTKVVSATIATAGTGGTPGAAVVTGTTGTGTKFQANVTISAGGIISAVNSIALAGDYTADMTDHTAEPVTGAALVGAQLNAVMGVLTVAVNNAGDYSVDPANPVAQALSTGAGVGATFTVTFATAATATDALLMPGPGEILDAQGFDHVAAIRVAADGSLDIRALDN